MKGNGFTLKKKRGRQYSAETLTDADNADGQAFLNNLEQAAGGFGLDID